MGRIRLVHYHTDTINATPKSENLSLGEIAINTNPNNPFIMTKLSDDSISQYRPFDNLKVTIPNNTSSGKQNSFDWVNKNDINNLNFKIFYYQSGDTNNTNEPRPSYVDWWYNIGLFWTLNGIYNSLSYSHISPVITFAGAYSATKDNPWTMKICGSDGKVYDFDNFRSKTSETADKVNGSLNLAGTTYNGSSNVTIDKLDCGEF